MATFSLWKDLSDCKVLRMGWRWATVKATVMIRKGWGASALAEVMLVKEDRVKWRWEVWLIGFQSPVDRWKIKTKLSTIYIKILGFGKPEGNPVKSGCRNTRLTQKYLVQRHHFRNDWHNRLFVCCRWDGLTVDEMAPDGHIEGKKDEDEIR